MGEPNKEKRAARITVSYQLIKAWLLEKTDLPKDIEVYNLMHKEDSENVLIFMTSNEFEPVIEGAVIPDITTKVKASTGDTENINEDK